MTTAYAFTLKLNTKAGDRERATKQFYQAILDEWAKVGIIRASVFEYDNSRRRHAHGIIELPEDFRYSTLRPDGCHTCFKPIHDLKGWNRYINKDKNLMRYVMNEPKYNYIWEGDLDGGEVGRDIGSDCDTAEVIKNLRGKLFSPPITYAEDKTTEE